MLRPMLEVGDPVQQLTALEDVEALPASPQQKPPAGLGRGLARLDTRVELIEEEGTSELGKERWTFDEDAYTVGLGALVSKTFRGASRELIFAGITPLLQFGIYFKLMSILIDLKPNDKEVSLIVRSVCCFLALVQLSNEAVEGLHKAIFSLRGFCGLYGDICKVSMMLGVLLGFWQALLGAGTFLLCARLIQASESELDAMMNFIALSFIADIDNVLLSSRLVQPFIRVEPDITVQLAPQDWCRKGRQTQWGWRMAFITNLAIALCSGMTAGVSISGGRTSPHGAAHLAKYVPTFLCYWAATVLAMWFGSKRWGVCYTALSVNKVFYALFLAHYLANKLTDGGVFGDHWFLWSPWVSGVMMGITISFIPSSFAVTLEPFDQFYLLPLEVVLWFVLVYMAADDFQNAPKF